MRSMPTGAKAGGTAILKDRVHRCVVACVGIVALVLGGCRAAGTSGRASAVVAKVDVVSSEQVELSRPEVSLRDGVLRLSGAMNRKAGFEGPVSGRLLVTLVEANGEPWQYVPLGWSPDPFTSEVRRPATYRLAYSCEPPPGISVVVEHIPNWENFLKTPSGGGGGGAPGRLVQSGSYRAHKSVGYRGMGARRAVGRGGGGGRR